MLKRIEKLTAAETRLLELADSLPSAPARRRAAELLSERGLPGRRVEAWHYTDLRVKLKPVSGLAPPADERAAIHWLENYPWLIKACRIPILNGDYLAASADALPDGVLLRVRESLPSASENADAVALIGALGGGNGLEIEIRPGSNIELPIGLAHGAISPGLIALRHSVTVGAGASVTIVERHLSADDVANQTNSVVDLDIGEGAKVSWAIVQQEGEIATHLAQLNVRLAARAQLEILVLNAGGALVRREIRIKAEGEGATLAMRGVNLIGSGSHIDVATELVHKAPGVKATEIFRNVVTGDGQGAFQGVIRVDAVAQKTDARMACNTLLLSDEGEFSAKPELEIFADDVQCGHGATVSDILPEHLFYLRARGIPERQARAMLVRGFVEDTFSEVENETLRDALIGQIENWLDRHG